MAKFRLLKWGLFFSVIVFIIQYFFIYLKFKPTNSTSGLLSIGVGIEIIILLSLVLGFIIGGIIVIIFRRKEIK